MLAIHRTAQSWRYGRAPGYAHRPGDRHAQCAHRNGCFDVSHPARRAGRSIPAAIPRRPAGARDPVRRRDPPRYRLSGVLPAPRHGPGVRLVPDPYFFLSRGYGTIREVADGGMLPAWDDRRDVVFWRGSPTVRRHAPDGTPTERLDQIPRVALCLLLRDFDGTDAAIMAPWGFPWEGDSRWTSKLRFSVPKASTARHCRCRGTPSIATLSTSTGCASAWSLFREDAARPLHFQNRVALRAVVPPAALRVAALCAGKRRSRRSLDPHRMVPRASAAGARDRRRGAAFCAAAQFRDGAEYRV